MAEPGHEMKPKATDIICCLISFLAIVLLAALMILPRWIPRDNPEGVYNARIWLANCLCDDGRASLSSQIIAHARQSCPIPLKTS